jgi:endonuclease/exonuclease/phosphatase family metal-dependent hydrolase
MDYKYKYLKYKTKYQNLKNNKKYTQEGGVHVQCPPNTKICQPPTYYMGVCIDNKEDCNKEYDEKKAIIPTLIWTDTTDDIMQKEKYELGLKKGYVEDFLNKDCGHSIKLAKYKNKDKNCSLPSNFSILTLNIMGIIRNDENGDKLKLMKERVKIFIDEINTKNPDIMCFQEMSSEVLNELYPKIQDKYPYCYEKNLADLVKERKKDIELCIISKYQPRKVTVMNLGGNLGYFNSLSKIKYDNVNIFNCYFQAGSKYSPGQQNKYIHYSRCRAQQFNHIKNFILKDEKTPVIVLGDFNCHLDGDESEWSELKYLKEMNLRDSWKELHPDKLGLTENTDLNHLRFNSKFEEKHYRYDAILFNKLHPKTSVIVGDIPKLIEDDEINRIYERIILPKNGLINPNLRIAKKENDKNYYDLFISDHFGLLSSFEFEHKK